LDDHPSRFPLPKAKIKQNNEKQTNENPAKSKEGSFFGRLLLGIKKMPIIIASAMVGTVRKKMYRQLNKSITTPPSVGPMAGAKTMPMLNNPIAVPRRSGGKTLKVSAIAMGWMMPAVTPCRNRPAIRVSVLGAMPLAAEPPRKRARHTT
jgi:hypothetical protein